MHVFVQCDPIRCAGAQPGGKFDDNLGLGLSPHAGQTMEGKPPPLEKQVEGEAKKAKIKAEQHAPCTSVLPVSFGFPGSENALTSLRRFSNAIANNSGTRTSAVPPTMPTPSTVEEAAAALSPSLAGSKMRCEGTSGPSSSGCTSTHVRSHEAYLVSASVELERLVTVPRTMWGHVTAAFFWSSSHFARFFCRIRWACRLRADSTLRVAEV